VSRDHGRWFAVRFRLFKDPDFQKLSTDARLVLFGLMGTIESSTGFGRLSFELLQEATGLDSARILAGLDVLKAEGWVKLDGRVAWIVNFMRYQPTVSASKEWSAHIEARLAEFHKSPLVAEFRAHYDRPAPKFKEPVCFAPKPNGDNAD